MLRFINNMNNGHINYYIDLYYQAILGCIDFRSQIVGKFGARVISRPFLRYKTLTTTYSINLKNFIHKLNIFARVLTKLSISRLPILFDKLVISIINSIINTVSAIRLKLNARNYPSLRFWDAYNYCWISKIK